MNILAKRLVAYACLVLPGCLLARGQELPRDPRPRLVITADPELDDNNSLIRAVLYSSDFRLEGLVYVSSGVHWRGDGKGTTQYLPGREYTWTGQCPAGCTSWRWPDAGKEKFIDAIVAAYAKSYANLRVHDHGYPSPEHMRSIVRWGNVDFEGDYSKDTDGSNLIKQLLLDREPGPLFVTAQGGQSTIARALKSIYDQYHATPDWKTVQAKVSRKLILIPWGDQDGTYARYIHPNWPDVQNWQLRMIDYGYLVRDTLPAQDSVYLSGQWTRANVLSRGPLGALYRVWGDGKAMVANDPSDYYGLTGYSAEQLKQKGYVVFGPLQEKGAFISEGDTPTFLNLIANGLEADRDGYWGGWGGIRRENAQPSWYQNIQPVGPDDPGVAEGLAPAGTVNQNAAAAKGHGSLPAFPKAHVDARTAEVNARFFAAAQNDFAARLRWATTPAYKDANHAPHLSLDGPQQVQASRGSTVRQRARTSDPDGDTVHLHWWQYNDAGTYGGDVKLVEQPDSGISFVVPEDAKPGETIHVIAEATDTGTPALTRYARWIVTVK